MSQQVSWALVPAAATDSSSTKTSIQTVVTYLWGPSAHLPLGGYSRGCWSSVHVILGQWGPHRTALRASFCRTVLWLVFSTVVPSSVTLALDDVGHFRHLFCLHFSEPGIKVPRSSSCLLWDLSCHDKTLPDAVFWDSPSAPNVRFICHLHYKNSPCTCTWQLLSMVTWQLAPSLFPLILLFLRVFEGNFTLFVLYSLRNSRKRHGKEFALMIF